tara:strand:+ start:545 stop:1018 length:474 start_codon:yes stop_codon:yes gene_type:complete
MMSEDNENQMSLEDFMSEVKEQDKEYTATFGSGEFESRETLKAERDKPYLNYIVEGYSSNVEGKFGKNTAIRITSPAGEKQTLWVNNYEEQHFNQFIARLEKQGITTVEDNGNLSSPVKISFAKTQEVSEKTGNPYNKLMIKLVAHGDDVQIELDNL